MENQKKNLFDDSDEDEFVPQGQNPEQPAQVETIPQSQSTGLASEPSGPQNAKMMFDDDDGEEDYVPAQMMEPGMTMPDSNVDQMVETSTPQAMDFGSSPQIEEQNDDQIDSLAQLKQENPQQTISQVEPYQPLENTNEGEGEEQMM